MKKRTTDYTQYIKPILPLRPVSHIGFKLPKTGGIKPSTSFLQPVKPIRDYSETINHFFITN